MENNQVGCKRAKIRPQESCNFMINRIKREQDKCLNFKSFELCKVFKNYHPEIQTFLYTFDCSFLMNHCEERNIGVFSSRLGKVILRNFNVPQGSVEDLLEDISRIDNFAVIQCKMSTFWYLFFKSKKYYFQPDSSAQQFIWFTKKPENFHVKTAKINRPSVNVLIFDSVSRTEFYYAMSKTVQVMRQISGLNETRVLDFKLHQSVARDTNENMVRLFNGESLPKQKLNSQKVNLTLLTSKFFHFFIR